MILKKTTNHLTDKLIIWAHFSKCRGLLGVKSMMCCMKWSIICSHGKVGFGQKEHVVLNQRN